MILFIAPNPFKDKEREGYLQRVLSIDAIFKDYKKVYSGDCKDSTELAKLMIEADLIYVHSIYRAEEIIDCYSVFGYKIITDLHGVVPEEEELIGEIRRSGELNIVEEKVFRYGAAFVAVTNSMADHFRKKYNLKKSQKWTILPIFDTKINSRKEKSPNLVVYAGGTQKWQNINLIVDAINQSNKRYVYDLMTHNPHDIQGIDNEKLSRVKIHSVASDKVGKNYEKASLGFMLRDDVEVNRVACPTKLIEYLSSGVVPIVKSPEIGDFRRFGYQYITYEEFLKGEVSNEVVSQKSKHNYSVIGLLNDQTTKGTKGLLNIVNKVIEIKGIGNIQINLVASAIDNSLNTRQLNAANYQISEQVRIIHEYADAMNLYKARLERIRSIKVVKILRSLKRASLLINSNKRAK